MKKLEKSPESYDKEFYKLFPESKAIYDLLLTKLEKKNGKILEVGCGTGKLAKKLARMGFQVIGVDISSKMIEYAKKRVNDNQDGKISYLCGDFVDYSFFNKLKELGPFDFIISTFALSEFTDLRQKLFLKQARNLLHPKGGKLFLATDTYPSFFLKKFLFSFKRFVNLQMSIFKPIESTNPVRDIEHLLLEQFSFHRLFRKKNVIFYECHPKGIDASFYESKPLRQTLGKFGGIKRSYCILNGILMRKSVKSGLYHVGKPNKKLPLLVTANYYWTHCFF